MPKLRFDFLVIETFERLFGASAFLEMVDHAIPGAEFQEREELRRIAHEQNWEIGQLQAEDDVLDEKFRHWLPRLAAYSVVILLQSIVETQLVAYAERVGRVRDSPFRLKDVRGRGIEQATIYLERVVALDVKQDPAWSCITDLQELRNIIVHRGGKPGESVEQQRAINRMLQAYEGKLLLPPPYKAGKEMWISMHLCRHFLVQTEGFFRRLFKTAGLSEMPRIHVTE